MDPTFEISLVSAFFAFVLAFQSYHVFSYVKKSYLLNFSFGFLLLGLSYALLIPLALGFKLPAYFADADDIVNYPAFALMQTFGYFLIALSYVQTGRTKEILTGAMGSLTILVAFSLFSSMMKIPDPIDILLYLLNTSLLAYVLYHMLKVMPPKDLVFLGFLLLALHEYTSLIGSFNEAVFGIPDEGSFLVAEVLRCTALCMLAASFLVVRYHVFSGRRRMELA